MGALSAIGGALGSVFSGPIPIDKVIDKAAQGLDKLYYSPEEKADDRAKHIQQQADIRLRAQEQVVEWMKATAPQAVTRRFIAKRIVTIWMIVLLVPTALVVASIWFPDRSQQLLASAKAIYEGTDDIHGYMLLVLGFYMGAPHVSRVMDAIVTRSQGRRKPGEAIETDGS